MADETTSPAPLTGRAIRRRFFLRTLREKWPLTGALLVLSVLLSAVPAIKSQLESALISAINDAVREGSAANLRDALNRPVDELSGSGDEGAIEGLVLDIGSLAFSETPLWGAAASYVAIAIVAGLLAWASAATRAELTRSFFTRLRTHGMRSLMDPSIATLRPNSGPEDHGTTVQQGALNVASGYSGLIQLGQYFLAIVTTTLFVVQRSPELAGAIWLAIGLQALIMRLKTQRLSAERQKLEDRRDRVVARSDDIIANRDVIAAHERRDHYQAVLDDLAGEYGDTERALSRKDQWYRSLSIIVADVGRMGILFVALAIAVGAWGSGIADIGDAYFIVAIYLRMLTPAQNLLEGFDRWRQSRDTSTRFRNLLVDRPAPGPSSQGPPLASSSPTAAATFHDVVFDYEGPDGAPERALDHCTLTLPAGKTSLIVGRSGSGKTTIARILLGFLLPGQGQVVLRDRDIAAWPREELMREISYLAQGHHVLADTVRANLFSDGGDDARLAGVLLALGLPAAGSTHEQALELLEKPARDLSIGQQQRIALARVLVDDDPIVVMDEPVAGVDAFTFRDVLPAFARLFQDPARTVVIISHRVAFAAHVDHVIVLDEGRVLEEGSREELISRRGTFYELYTAAYRELVGRGSPSS